MGTLMWSWHWCLMCGCPWDHHGARVWRTGVGRAQVSPWCKTQALSLWHWLWCPIYGHSWSYHIAQVQRAVICEATTALDWAQMCPLQQWLQRPKNGFSGSSHSSKAWGVGMCLAARAPGFRMYVGLVVGSPIPRAT